MTTAASMTGLILAGGQARRMQDGMAPTVDKGLLELCGEPLVAHARRFLAPQVQALLISANRNAPLYARYGDVVGDDAALGTQLGPLAGMERALSVIKTPWLIVLPVDVVNVPDELVARLWAAVQPAGPLVAYARTPERAHPLCMVLHASLADSLRRYLQAGDRKVQLWQARHQAVAVPFDGAGLFFNINTPEDLRYASQCRRS
ncbi:molybdenum cofactor guanylyltransferase MobA [Pusillimonas sp. SM2304]|uniref:molybdenum cofactor guanylyltransferase MobA n=1 Tax=Pusillimonas sp. SM2304 TaxID=3073241 RepID=UPI00287658E4|nr:molybdenum cofactor guanylyltransferase MobA [Pusillimonas sp. SM2304]MDS1140607.1 molybdenum cofactor guanylyltransferase MobA [Pusillimonas sp. SM2304]